MEFRELISLVNAGFSKSDIEKFLTAYNPKKEAEEPAEPMKKEEPKNEEPEKEEPKNEEPANILIDAIKDLNSTIQRINIQGSNIDALPDPNKEVDNILASIINPPNN